MSGFQQKIKRQAHQQTGRGGEENQLAWKYVSRNFQNWKAKRKKNQKQNPQNVQELWDNHKGVIYMQWEYRKEKEKNERNTWSINSKDQVISQTNAESNHRSRKPQEHQVVRIKKKKKSIPKHFIFKQQRIKEKFLKKVKLCVGGGRGVGWGGERTSHLLHQEQG